MSITNIALYGYKLNARESWSLVQRMTELGNVTSFNVGDYKAYLQGLLRATMENAGTLTVIFISDAPLYNNEQIMNSDSYTIVIGEVLSSGVARSEIESARRVLPDNVRVYRRFFRDAFDLRLDFCSTDPRLWYGHVVPAVPIQLTITQDLLT